MAVAIQLGGLATIKVCTTGGVLATLGYSLNGVDITDDILTEPVYGDANGGEGGPPIDIQQLGEIHTVRMTLTKYDETVLNTIRASMAGGTAGTTATSGALYFQGSLYWRLLIHSVNTPRNYLCAIFTEAKEVNLGTKHSKAIITAKCYQSGGVVYNATTT